MQEMKLNLFTAALLFIALLPGPGANAQTTEKQRQGPAPQALRASGPEQLDSLKTLRAAVAEYNLAN